MGELLFTDEHEWLRLEGDSTCVIGITDYAQEQLGELVYVELPEVNSECEKGAEISVIESVKAASELYAPVTGTVIEVNESIIEDPSLVNSDPLGDGWFIKVRLTYAEALGELMDGDAYAAFVAGLA